MLLLEFRRSLLANIMAKSRIWSSISGRLSPIELRHMLEWIGWKIATSLTLVELILRWRQIVGLNGRWVVDIGQGEGADLPVKRALRIRVGGTDCSRLGCLGDR